MSYARQFAVRLAISLGAGTLTFAFVSLAIRYFEGGLLAQKYPQEEELRLALFAQSTEGGFASAVLVTFCIFLFLSLRADRVRVSKRSTTV